MERQRVDILGVQVDCITQENVLVKINHWIETLERVYLCFAPVSTLVMARENAGYSKIVNEADIVSPDGVPVVWAARMKGAKEIERVCGYDMMERLCMKNEGRAYRHFFYGSTQEVLDRLEARLTAMNPEIIIAGKIAPVFQSEVTLESQEMIDRINAAKPDILWVGLGSPKQDIWMKLHRDKITAPVMMGVGAAFDFLAGVKPRAPQWMQRAGLEWFFRFLCEPQRLWRRYCIGNSKFVFFLLKDSLGFNR